MGKKGGSKPTYQPPPAPKLQQASELLPKATDWAKSNFANAYGAREGALADISRGTDYYQSFAPTSLEQALSDQYFANVMPDLERSIKHSLSLSGIESSPVLAEQIAKARGQVGVNVGQFLSNQANTRATNSLNARLGIDPASIYSPYLNTDVNQSNQQASYDYNYAQQKAQADFQKELQDYQEKQAKINMISKLGGAALGFAVGGPAGMALGMGAADTLSPLWGGGNDGGGGGSSGGGGGFNPMGYIDLANGLPGGGLFNFKSGGGGSSPMSLMNSSGFDLGGSGIGDLSSMNLSDMGVFQGLGLQDGISGSENFLSGLQIPMDWQEAQLVF